MNDKKQYQVWFIPTEKGRKFFGWSERLMGGPDLMTQDEARYEAYIANRDEPAPDAYEYGSYIARKVSDQT